jgi:serine/threonine-protein kinase
MASVYLARDDARDRLVALKLLDEALARDERFRQRFLRESRLAQGLDNPHIVSTLSSGEQGGLLYLVMAYIDGSDLRELLRREGRLDARRAVDLVGQVAEGLDAAHAAGLVHRDVKPGNILVAELPEGEHAYVCDFGLARHVSSVGSLTGDRGFVGTIEYVAPEQIEGAPVDRRADVYSLCCVLFECLAGERPFDRESELAAVFAHLNEPPPRLSDVRPELPEAFDAVFATGLAKKPDERYSSCGELAEAARGALSGASSPRRKPRRRRFLMAAVALLAAIAAIVGGVVLTTPGSHVRPPVSITQTSIAGAPLGLKMADYKRLLGVPWRQDVFATMGVPVLIQNNKKVSVYFNPSTHKAAEITTWNKAYTTDRGIGPCSSVAALKKAYGPELKPSPPNTIKGLVFAYTVGDLIFGANGRPPNPPTTVTAVALYSPSGIGPKALNYAGFVVLQEIACS